MERRTFLAGVGALLAAPAAVGADEMGKVPVVAFLGSSTPTLQPLGLKAFRDGLRQRGYVEGVNLIVEYRWAEGVNARYPALVADVLRMKPSVLVSECGPALQAIRAASRTVPLVVAACADPTHFYDEVKSLARPGGQTTGLTMLAPEATGKRFELLRELSPHVSRIAVLHNAGDPWSDYWAEMRAVGRLLKLTLRQFTIGDAQSLEQAFATMARDRIDAVFTLPDAIAFSNRDRIAALAMKYQLPTAFDIRAFVLAGGLMSYGPYLPDLFGRAAAYVDQILKGKKPGDLPVERPTRFVLVLNVKTAKALGLTIPASVMARTDELIE